MSSNPTPQTGACARACPHLFFLCRSLQLQFEVCNVTGYYAYCGEWDWCPITGRGREVATIQPAEQDTADGGRWSSTDSNSGSGGIVADVSSSNTNWRSSSNNNCDSNSNWNNNDDSYEYNDNNN